MLRYLAEHALEHPGVPLKEYQIAVEVLGRSGGFDPQSDSAVRVQAGRLRVKLEEYYAHEGENDAVVVELPKGSYALTFHARTLSTGVTESAPRTRKDDRRHPAPGLSPRPSNRGWMAAVVILSILLACALLWAGHERMRSNAKVAVPAAYRIFWSRFVNGSQQPWVIFSNGSFVGRPETGMRYFDPSADAGSLILDHYTGVGEVLAVHQLDRVFVLLNQPLRVKRGSLVSLDDAKNNDLIFVGSPAENLVLLDIPGTQEFIFQRISSGPRSGDLGVFNTHPQAGEPQIFLGSPANQPTTEDYAVIALVPGIDPARSVLILAGTTTFGTQAAAEYVCRQDSLEELLRRLGVSKTADFNPFEALLHVKVTHGVPVMTDLVAIRKRGS
ncbi:MAG: hypothetical protein WB523_06635 [Candidatus Sulfotelmatobacter sp.]